MEIQRRRLQQLQLLEAQLELVELEMKKRDAEERRREERREDRRANWKQRTVWTRAWILRWPMFGNYDQLLAELNREDGSTYQNFLCIDNDLFGDLLHHITPMIQKDTRYRRALPAGLKLAIALHYLASWNIYTDFQFQFHVPDNSISLFVPEVCEALKELQNEVMPRPGVTEEY